MSLYRIDTISVVDARRCTEFYVMTDWDVWYWNDYDNQWDEAWQGLIHHRNNRYWTKTPSTPLEFLLLTGKVFREPT